MASHPSIGSAAFTRMAVKRLQVLSTIWMTIECGVALYGAWQAHSVVLMAFGADSLVELLSAILVLLAFSPRIRISRTRSAQLAGILLYVLAGVVVITAILAWRIRIRPESSPAGIAITIAALVGMPVLAWQKRRLSRETGSQVLAADSVQSATCAWMAAAALAGLIADATLHVRWVDSVAALAVLPLLLLEARNAMRGESCGCCSSAAAD
ncbi:MAG TPA: cation transporter [Acidobacteriaceae bacterium]|nr:cation transporter [Acidobacteriaceae bacterium]